MAAYILVIPIAKLTAGYMYRMWRKFEVNYSIVYKVYKVKKLPATTVGSNL